jgi:uncharacterized protein (DUF3084 family)
MSEKAQGRVIQEAQTDALMPVSAVACSGAPDVGVNTLRAFDEVVARILAASRPGVALSSAIFDTSVAELEVRSCIEELLRSHELDLQGRHSQELAKQREHHEHIEHFKKRRAVLMHREAIGDEENQNQRQVKEEAKVASKFVERERRLLEREQAVEARHQQVDDALLANEEKQSDLEVQKHRLQQEASRLASLKADLEHRLQASNTERAREGSQRETLDARERDLASSERSLASKRAEIGSLERNLAERQKEVAARENSLAEREKASAELRKDSTCTLKFSLCPQVRFA